MLALLLAAFLASTTVSITEPVDGETYNGNWLTVRAIVENENVIPDSVHYSLNGEPVIPVPRLNTDWYTYMADDLHRGFSESPAPTDNTILWTAPVTGDYHEFPTPVVVDGIVYYPQDSTGDSLYALDSATGELIWKFRTGYTDDAVTVKDGYLYTASDNLWCLDACTGEEIWVHGGADNQGSTPVVSGGCVYSGTAEYSQNLSHIYSLDALTGSNNWSVSVSGFTASCMTVWNNMLFVPTYNGPLYALNSSSGEVLWDNTESGQGYWDSSPVVIDDLIYICGIDSKVRAIDPADGTTVWAVNVTPGTYIAATLAYHDGRLYFGDQVDSFHCLDVADGSTIWSVPGVEHGSTGLADGLVFYGQGSNYYDETASFFCLDWDTGDVVWSYLMTTGPYGIVSSPSITDGVVYIAGTDNNLYAFGTGLKYTYLDDLYAQTGSNELIVTSFHNGAALSDTVNFTVTGAGISIGPSQIFNLAASPNPFHSNGAVSFELSESGHTTLEIFDVSGRRVASLADSELSAGSHSIQWNGSDENGIPCAAGLYLCRLQSGNAVETTGICLLR